VVAEVVKKHIPDWRRVLNELQRYSATGKIDAGILSSLSDENFKKLIASLKAKNFNEMRKWVVENADSDTTVFRKVYDHAHDILKPSSIPAVVLLIADYQYKAAFVADHEINLAAFLTNLMVEAEWL
jgi:hypothetical protein